MYSALRSLITGVLVALVVFVLWLGLQDDALFPVNLTQPITITENGEAIQNGHVIGRFREAGQGQELAIPLLRPSATTPPAWSGVLKITFSDNIRTTAVDTPEGKEPSTAIVSDVVSIQGDLPFITTWHNRTTLLLSGFEVLAEGYPILKLHAPPDYFNLPLRATITGYLRHLPLPIWVILAATIPTATILYKIRKQQLLAWSPAPEQNHLLGDLNILELAILHHSQLRATDLAAALINLAQRGFLQIVEHADGQVVFLRTEGKTEMAPYEEELLRLLFQDTTQPVTLSTLINQLNEQLFSEQVSNVFSAVCDSFQHRGYFLDENPRFVHLRYKTTGILMQLAGLVLVGVGYFFLQPGLPGITLIGTGLYTAGLVHFGTGYRIVPTSPLGKELVSYCSGFRSFLASPAPFPAERNDSEIFFNYVPHALVLDCLPEWQQRFLGQIPASLPDWFTSESTATFTADRFIAEVDEIALELSRALHRSKDPNID